MKKLVVLMMMVVGATAMATDSNFNISLKLFKPIALTKGQDLLIPQATLTGSAFDIVVATSDSGAASFSAIGGKNRTISRQVVESSIDLSASGVTGKIAVDNFVLAGPTAFDASGNIAGLKIGATAHVLSGSEDGDYSGTAAMRVTYN